MSIDKRKNKNSVKKAIALSYENDDIAPKIIAKGEGFVAEKIIEKAIEGDVLLYRDKDLAEELISLEIDDIIPEELYEVVAEILLYIYSLDKQRGR